MNVEHTLSGLIVISDIIGNVRVQEKYVGYTEKEARRLFKEKHKPKR